MIHSNRISIIHNYSQLQIIITNNNSHTSSNITVLINSKEAIINECYVVKYHDCHVNDTKTPIYKEVWYKRNKYARQAQTPNKY